MHVKNAERCYKLGMLAKASMLICQVATVLVYSLHRPALAQIIPDASLGVNSSVVVSETGTRDRIDGGLRQNTALFHSFQDFNIKADSSAYFTNPANIETIFTRVTGNNPSELLGTLGVLGNADLFFLNPNGIILAPNSSLDMGGSFIASTADSVVFDNGTIFSATAPETRPSLTINTPIGLQFGHQPAPIQYQAQRFSRSRGLILQPGKTLALVGGDLEFQGANLQSIGGRIELGSIAEAGTVGLSPRGQGWHLNYDNHHDNHRNNHNYDNHNNDTAQPFGDLTATLSFVNTAIDTIGSLAPTESDGDIVIQARNITLNRSTIIRADTFTDLPGGDITINAQTLALNRGSSILARALSGPVNDIRGSAGNITINARESVTVRGGLDFFFAVSPSTISVSIDGESINRVTGVRDGRVLGNAGNLVINTQRLLVAEGGNIDASSNSVGNAGDIIINATESIDVTGFFAGRNNLTTSAVITSTRGGTGLGGELIVNTPQLRLTNTGALFSESRGPAPGGKIIIHADIVEAAGSMPLPNNNNLVLISGLTTDAEAQGNAGEIRINARQVLVSDGARIATATRRGSQGNGGFLSIYATERVQIEGTSLRGTSSALLSRTLGTGNAGQLQVKTPDLRVINGGEISAATVNRTAQFSGSIDLRVNRIRLDQGRLTVATRAESSGGGDILMADLNLLLLRNGSLISAEAFDNANGGNIRINAEDGFLLAPFAEDSDIIARANQGNGGNIDIVAQNIWGLAERPAIRNNGTNDIDASSQFGVSGTVTLNQLDVDPTQDTGSLPTDTGAPEISQRCNPSQDVSSFVTTGRGGVPLKPGDAIAPQTLWEELYTPDSQTLANNERPTLVTQTSSNSLVEAQTWETSAAGDIVLIAENQHPSPQLATMPQTCTPAS